jgi:heme/copper-type cytochrome/quinol oxidase subunit 2
MLQLLFNLIQCDAPRPWGIYFQDSAAPQMEGLVELHDSIMFYLVLILFGVGWILTSVIVNYASSKSPISHKYLNHGKNWNLLFKIVLGDWKYFSILSIILNLCTVLLNYVYSILDLTYVKNLNYEDKQVTQITNKEIYNTYKYNDDSDSPPSDLSEDQSSCYTKKIKINSKFSLDHKKSDLLMCASSPNNSDCFRALT